MKQHDNHSDAFSVLSHQISHPSDVMGAMDDFLQYRTPKKQMFRRVEDMMEALYAMKAEVQADAAMDFMKDMNPSYAVHMVGACFSHLADTIETAERHVLQDFETISSDDALTVLEFFAVCSQDYEDFLCFCDEKGIVIDGVRQAEEAQARLLAAQRNAVDALILKVPMGDMLLFGTYVHEMPQEGISPAPDFDQHVKAAIKRRTDTVFSREALVVE